MIPIYKSEIDAGLSEQIKNSHVSMACAISPLIGTPDNQELLKALAKANPNQKDLFYKQSILASVGWNHNGDVFDRMETWKAKNSPVDKQINFMHNELEIIGHSTASYVIDQTGNQISNDTKFEDLPDKFDVVTQFVLYQIWDNEQRSDMMEKLVAEIEEGKWYVSMECRFPNFDYAIIDLDGTHKIVARSKDTAFLSKHLKMYGGKGEYEGRQVGRLLRDFFFSGQGIVNKPANERSIIFSDAILFNSKANLKLRGNQMDEVELLKKQVAKLETQLSESEAKKSKEETDKMQKDMDSAKCALADAVKAHDATKAKLTEVETAVQSKDSAIATLTSELKTVNDKLTVATAEMNAVKKESAKVARASKLATAGVATADVEAVVNKWENLSDEQFGEIVSMHKKAATATVVVVPGTKTTATVTDAVVEPGATLNTSTEDSAKEEFKTIASFLGTAMRYNSAAEARKEKVNK